MNEYIKQNSWLVYVSWVGYIVVMITLCCFVKARRTVPWNYILLFLLTLFLSLSCATTCVYSDAEAIMFAAGLTLFICVSVSIFSCYSKFDFTKWSSIMFIILIVFILAGIVMIFVPSDRKTQLIYATIGVIIFTIYLAIDTQRIVGGYKEKYSPEDYILAALSLYIDVIFIFMFLLSIGRLR